jgi:hypothetical protein
MTVDPATFKDLTGAYETSDGANLAEALSQGRHALVLLRHFG